MDFFKVVVDMQLVDMEEASCETEGSKDVMMDDLTPEAQEDDHLEV